MLTIFLSLLGFILVILLSIIFLVLGVNFRIQQLKDEKYSDEERYQFINKVCSLAIPLLFRVEIEVDGLEKLDKIEKGVLFPNHQSNIDIIALLKVIKRPHGYISKKELDHIFLLSDGMKLIHCQFMDRNDVRQSVKIILEATNVVKKGHLMVIFPEGTRMISGKVGTFKAGSFKVAQKAKADIIPVTIYNSYEVVKRWPRKTVIKMLIHEPMTYQMYEKLSTNEISEKVEKIVKQKLIEI